MRIALITLFWVVGVAAAPMDAAEDDRQLDLVRDGKAIVTIVRAGPGETEAQGKEKAGKRKPAAEIDETLAVQTLVEWVKKITDVELPVADQAAEGAAAIYVGRAAIDAGLKLDDIVSDSREGIRIVADGRRVRTHSTSAPAG